MPLSLYQISVPPMTRMLKTMSAFIDKGRAHADANGMAHAELLEGRLAPDMLTLVGQVQRATDSAKFAAVRVGQVANLVMPDEEKTFDDLQARLARTIDFLQAVPADSMDGREEAEIVLDMRSGPVTFTGTSYLQVFALPNVYFHATTAYAILRHKGVPVGKLDFLGGR